jgi:hypothetical protein
LKIFFTAKEILTRLKRRSTEWEKNFASCIASKEYIESAQKTNPAGFNNTLNKWANELDNSQKKKYK